jgi:hypothetical protein
MIGTRIAADCFSGCFPTNIPASLVKLVPAWIFIFASFHSTLRPRFLRKKKTGGVARL